MSSTTLLHELKVYTQIARRMGDTVYGYYMRMRPPSPGAQPEDSLSSVALAFRTWHDGICDDIWGWVCYARPLTAEEVEQYELVPDEDNPNRYQQYGLVRGIRVEQPGRKAKMKREWVMEDGKPFRTSYKRKALVLLDELRKASSDGAVFKIVKITPKETTDGVPT